MARGLFLGYASSIDMGPLALIPSDQTLLRHDLQELERRGVAGRATTAELSLHFSNRARPPFPEDPQNLELGRRRAGDVGLDRLYTHKKTV